MPQSLSQILVHVVFSTKDRYPFIATEVRPELHAYAATILQGCESPALTMNSVADHMHLLCKLSKKRAACSVIEDVKKHTSRWIKEKGGMLRKFQWQRGYGAFSVSPSNVDAVKTYVANQEEHHRRITFQDEWRELLRKHGIEFDERYLWD